MDWFGRLKRPSYPTRRETRAEIKTSPPVEQRQQREPVEMQADPQVWEEPEAVVLLGLAGGSRGRGAVLSHWRVLQLRAQVSVLLLQKLRVHGQQAVQTDLMEGELSRGQLQFPQFATNITNSRERVTFLFSPLPKKAC